MGEGVLQRLRISRRRRADSPGDYRDAEQPAVQNAGQIAVAPRARLANRDVVVERASARRAGPPFAGEGSEGEGG
jgi:hypothetical protein